MFHAYESFFEEFVGRSAVHLKLPNLPGNASLYCHQKQLASEESFESNEDFWDRQYECNLVPPLDRWFNLQSELYQPHKKKADQCVQWRVTHKAELSEQLAEDDEEGKEKEPAPSPTPDQEGGQAAANATKARLHPLASKARLPHPKLRVPPTALAAEGAKGGKSKPPDWRNYLRERYWAAHRPMITCGREVAQRSNWEVALHLRLGDLIAPVIGPGDSRREAHYSERAAQAARGLTRALSLLSHVQTTMRNASAATQFRTLVVSDSPYAVVSAFLKEQADVHLTVERAYHDDVATFTDVLARFSDSAPLIP